MRCCLISMPFQCQISNFAFGNISRPTYPTILGFERKCGNQASLVAARIEASDKTNMSDEICEASKLWTMLLKNMYIHWRWSDWWLFYTQRLKTNEGLSICRCLHVYSNQSVKILVFKQTTLWSQSKTNLFYRRANLAYYKYFEVRNTKIEYSFYQFHKLNVIIARRENYLIINIAVTNSILFCFITCIRYVVQIEGPDIMWINCYKS